MKYNNEIMETRTIVSYIAMKQTKRFISPI